MVNFRLVGSPQGVRSLKTVLVVLFALAMAASGALAAPKEGRGGGKDKGGGVEAGVEAALGFLDS